MVTQPQDLSRSSLLLATTKLHVPQVRLRPVLRRRLLQRLDAGSSRKLTVVSAPAGFGKTTLLGEWIRSGQQAVAWVSLDEGDNDPTSFLTYLTSALGQFHDRLGQGVLAALQHAQSPPHRTLLAELIQEMSALSGSYIVVLDDFHTISERLVHDLIVFLLDNMPPQLHLMISGRADPPWSLARLRVEGELVEVRAADLRFTPEETAQFLRDTMGLTLLPQDVEALEARTEGWIAGLQLAAISLQGRDDPTTFVRRLSGSNRFILDYLMDEVLRQQPEAVYDFLLQTSILRRLSAPLCRAVTGAADSERLLAELERANLFLVALDDERRWYRYHHLFANLLRTELQRSRPKLVPALHLCASSWYEENDIITEAIDHAAEAGDMARVAQLASGLALSMIYHGELTTLVKWLDMLPPDVVHDHPWLNVSYGWTLVYAGKLDASEERLQEIESALRRQGEPSDAEALRERQRILGHVAAIRGYISALQGDLAQAVAMAEAALEGLTREDQAACGFAATLRASSLRWLGRLSAAQQAYTEAIAIARAADDSNVAVDALCDLSILHSLQGHLHMAQRTCWEALRIADEATHQGRVRLPDTGYANICMSAVLREQNVLDEALHHAEQGLALCRRWGQADILARTYMEVARVRQAAGDDAGAREAIEEAKRVGAGLSGWFQARAAAWEADLCLARGDLPGAARWAQEWSSILATPPEFSYLIVWITYARLLVAQGRQQGNRRALEEALALLDTLARGAEERGATGQVLEILTLQSMALAATGQTDAALAALTRALSLGEAEGYVRAFIEHGQPMAGLLRRLAAQGIRLNYVGQLLAALEAEAGQSGVEPAAESADMEPLSERELEVLRLLTTHLSYPEIADELFVAPSTVRSHVKSIYRKLDVHNRAEAVEHARRLNLIPPHSPPLIPHLGG